MKIRPNRLEFEDSPVLDLKEAGNAYVYKYGEEWSLTLYPWKRSPLLVQLLNIFGSDRVVKEPASTNQVQAKFETDGLSVKVYQSRRKCRKARVTHVIEFCGSLPENQYENVEIIDD